MMVQRRIKRWKEKEKESDDMSNRMEDQQIGILT